MPGSVSPGQGEAGQRALGRLEHRPGLTDPAVALDAAVQLGVLVELRVFEQQASDKPENVRAKIAEGKLRKWMEETVLLHQEHVNGDKYEGKTIEELRTNLSGTTGENVVIRRFARFAVGA